MGSTTFAAHGLQISSAIELPLPRMSSPGNASADDAGRDQPFGVVVRFGNVPTALDAPVTRTPVFQAASREFLFILPGVGRFLVRDGREVSVHLEPGAPQDVLGLHLAHAGLAAVLHQRGKLPLHASGVVVNGGCVAFLGGAYAGKSTIAAALNQRGYAALCDDICAVNYAEGIATVGSGTRQFQLWADAAGALGLSTELAPRAHPEGERFGFPFDLPVFDQPISLRRLYVLRESRKEPEGIRRLTGIEAFRCLFGYTYFTPHIAGFVAGPKAFETNAGIARSVRIFVWSRPWGLDRLEETVNCLEQHLRTDQP
jgi:hypothetical protein